MVLGSCGREAERDRVRTALTLGAVKTWTQVHIGGFLLTLARTPAKPLGPPAGVHLHPSRRAFPPGLGVVPTLTTSLGGPDSCPASTQRQPQGALTSTSG